MKKILLLAAVFTLLAGNARAGIITYTWHQTSTTWPGVVFDAWYRVMQNAAPQPADSSDPSPDFGGLVDFYVQGGNYRAITLADLVPSCLDSGGCDIGGDFHDWGSPYWWIDLPDFFYLAAIELNNDPWHLEFEYSVSADRIYIGDDNAEKRCWETELCTSFGYWATNFVPEPATLLAFGGGLVLVQLSLAARRKRRGKG